MRSHLRCAQHAAGRDAILLPQQVYQANLCEYVIDVSSFTHTKNPYLDFRRNSSHKAPHTGIESQDVHRTL